MSILTWILVYIIIMQIFVAVIIMDDISNILEYLFFTLFFPVYVLLKIVYAILYKLYTQKSKKYYGGYWNSTLVYDKNGCGRSHTWFYVKFLFKKPVKIEIKKDWAPNTLHPYITIKSKDK